MRWWPILLATGCGFGGPAVSTTGDGGGGVDSQSNPPLPDAMVDPNCTSFSHQFNTCATGFGPAVDLSGQDDIYEYNTDSGVLQRCQGGNFGGFPRPDGGCDPVTTPQRGTTATLMDVWLVDMFKLGTRTTLRISGSKAFGIAAPHGITIEGDIELIGGGGARGAIACGSSAGGDGNNGHGGGGGAFQRAGGNGGGALNGGAALVTFPDVVHGGCPGGRASGSGGDGGGGFYAGAGTSIVISGSINAGGKGGRKANQGGTGGGGGGSGGMILLEAPIVTFSGFLAANGGGGGEGNGGGDPNDGADAGRTTMQASGGVGGDSKGGDGGKGDAGTMSAGDGKSGSANGGDGGAGGGVGYIKLLTQTPQLTGMISPPAS